MKNTCKIFEKYYLDYIYDELKDSDKLYFEKHCATCDICKEELPKYIKTKSLINKFVDIKEPPQTLEEKIIQRIEKHHTSKKTNFFERFIFHKPVMIPLFLVLIICGFYIFMKDMNLKSPGGKIYINSEQRAEQKTIPAQEIQNSLAPAQKQTTESVNIPKDRQTIASISSTTEQRDQFEEPRKIGNIIARRARKTALKAGIDDRFNGDEIAANIKSGGGSQVFGESEEDFTVEKNNINRGEQLPETVNTGQQNNSPLGGLQVQESEESAKVAVKSENRSNMQSNNLNTDTEQQKQAPPSQLSQISGAQSQGLSQQKLPNNQTAPYMNLYNEGVQIYNQKNYQKAINIFKLVINSYSGELNSSTKASVYHYIAKSYNSLGNSGQAQFYYNIIFNRYPNYSKLSNQEYSQYANANQQNKMRRSKNNVTGPAAEAVDADEMTLDTPDNAVSY